MSRCSTIRHSMRSQSSCSSGATSSSSSSSSSVQRSLSFFNKENSYDKNSTRKKDIDNALSSMVCQDYQPFSIVNDKGFFKLIKTLDPRYELPTKYFLKKNMYSQFINLKQEIVEELKAIEFVSITCDMWSSKANESYLTVSCHFINDAFDLKYYVLATKPLLDNTNKNADNLASTIKAIFEEYGIEDKIVCIVTDNDTTMQKMCRNLQKRHLPCVAHSINLLVQDVLKHTSIECLIQKCKKIEKFFKSSNISTEKLKLKQNVDVPLKLIQEVPTRWNSCLAMIKRILQLKDSINSCLLEIDKSPCPLRSEKVLILHDLVAVLEPFDDATKQVSSSKTVTASLINPLICGLVISLDEAKNNIATQEVRDVLDFIFTKMRERLFPYETRLVTRISTMLDSRFKKEGFRVDSNADEALKLLDTEMTLTSIHLKRDDDKPISPPKETAPTNKLFGFMAQRLEKKQRSITVDSIIMKRQYLGQQNCDPKSNPLLYWKVNAQMEVLSEIAKKYLCIPASSVESERIFSSAGQIVSDRRTSLKPSNVDMLIFLHRNTKY